MQEYTEENGLTPKQYSLIEALVAGNTIRHAAELSGVAERTAYTWLKQPLFRQEYEATKRAMFDSEIDILRSGVSLAIEALRRNMTESKGYVQVAAASKWLDVAIDVHKMSELEARITELEELVKATLR